MAAEATAAEEAEAAVQEAEQHWRSQLQTGGPLEGLPTPPMHPQPGQRRKAGKGASAAAGEATAAEGAAVPATGQWQQAGTSHGSKGGRGRKDRRSRAAEEGSAAGPAVQLSLEAAEGEAALPPVPPLPRPPPAPQQQRQASGGLAGAVLPPRSRREVAEAAAAAARQRDVPLDWRAEVAAVEQLGLSVEGEVDWSAFQWEDAVPPPATPETSQPQQAQQLPLPLRPLKMAAEAGGAQRGRPAAPAGSRERQGGAVTSGQRGMRSQEAGQGRHQRANLESPPARFVSWTGDWVCRCERRHALKDACRGSCRHQAPCRYLDAQKWGMKACMRTSRLEHRYVAPSMQLRHGACTGLQARGTCALSCLPAAPQGLLFRQVPACQELPHAAPAVGPAAAEPARGAAA